MLQRRFNSSEMKSDLAVVVGQVLSTERFIEVVFLPAKATFYSTSAEQKAPLLRRTLFSKLFEVVCVVTLILTLPGCQTGKPFKATSPRKVRIENVNAEAATQDDSQNPEPLDAVTQAASLENTDTDETLTRVRFAGFQQDVRLEDAETFDQVEPPEPAARTEGNGEDTPLDAPDIPDEKAKSSETDDVTASSAAGNTTTGSESVDDVPTKISLDAVLQSVRQCYPEIDIAIGELEAANGKVLASWGQFDQVLSAHTISHPLGFYQTYRNGVGLSRPLYQGGEVYGTYRIGDGNFEPWYGERETNEGGEFKAGFSLPLLKDRAIDGRRAKLFATGYQRDQLNSNVEARMLMFQRIATQAYWDWVAAGQAVQIQQRLLQLANQRVDQIKTRVKAGDLARIAQIDNDRLIAKRKNGLIKARRQLEKTAIKLSLFWRDESCNPTIPADNLVPEAFPESRPISDNQLLSDIETALSIRPELSELAAARKEASTELRYARNLTLPKVDVKGFAGQDVGGETSSLGDKTPFELQLGVLAEVPLQRREGIGKSRAAQGKLKQIDAKIGFTRDKIRSEIQDAASGINASQDQITQSRENLRLTRKSLELGRISFEEGDIDLLSLNIYESAVADAELQLLEAQLKQFLYRTIYEIAIRGTFD